MSPALKPFVLAAALAVFGCTPQAPAPPATTVPHVAVFWKYPSEAAWLTAQVGLEIERAMAVAPASRTPLVPTPHVWASEAYQPWAVAVLKRARQQETPAAPAAITDDLLLERLGVLGAEPLLSASRLVSQALRDSPRDPVLHQQAALVVGAFALREPQGWYFDVRDELSRVTAHLALAEALAAGAAPTRAGRVARVIVETLAGRQVDATARLDALELEPGPEPVRSWLRALRIRNTRDWRLAGPRPTDVERSATLRELAMAVSDLKALAFLGDAPSAVTDWGRHLLAGSGNQVAAGNALVGRQLGLEATEIESVFGPASRPDLSLGARLAAARDDGTVLDQGLWARFLERRLVEYSGSFELHYSETLALDRDSVAMAVAALEAQLGELTLMPFARFRRSRGQSELERLLPALRELLTRHPERVTAANWWSAREKPGFGVGLASRLPDQTPWFTPPLPPGTTYDAGRRFRRVPALVRAPASLLEEAWRVAPHDRQLGWRLAKPGKEAPSEASIRRYFGPAVDFDAEVMSALLDTLEDQPEAYVPLAERLAALDPDRWSKLGQYLEKRDEAAAARAYEKMWKLAVDRVAFSQECGWLVEHYRSSGRIAEALRVARDAAAVHSAAGLDIYGELLEKVGRHAEAERTLRTAAERYDDWGPLVAFLKRTESTRGPERTREAVAQVATQALPQGIERVTRADFQAPPSDGVVIKSTSAKTDEAGLGRGAVIVAMNGVRIRDMKGLTVVRELVDGPRYRVLAWHAGRYVEPELELPGGRFGVDVHDYRP